MSAAPSSPKPVTTSKPRPETTSKPKPETKSASPGYFPVPARTAARQKTCPDLVSPFAHLEPKAFVLTALKCSILGALSLMATLTAKPAIAALNAYQDEDEQAAHRAEDQLAEKLDEVLARAPRAALHEALRDLAVRSILRGLETAVVYHGSEQLCRQLTTVTSKEFKRIDESGETRSFVEMAKTAFFSTLLLQSSTFVVYVSLSSFRAFTSPRSELVPRAAKADEEDGEEEELSPGAEDQHGNVRLRYFLRSSAVYLKLGVKSAVVTSLFAGAAAQLCATTGFKLVKVGWVTGFLGEVSLLLL